MAWADLWAVEMLLAAFAGGAFGAALGALPAFIFTGFMVIADEAANVIGKTVAGASEAGAAGELAAVGITGSIAFGPVFSPAISFAGGAAAAAYAAKRGYMDTDFDFHEAKNIAFAQGTKPDVLAVGGAFGIVGYWLTVASSTLGMPYDPIAMGVVLSAVIHRIVFGYDIIGDTSGGILDMSPFEDGDRRIIGEAATADSDGGREPAADGGTAEGRFVVEPWLPHQYKWANVATLGVVVGILAAFTAYTTGSPFLAFGISAASLVFLNCGVEQIPVTHHISLPASTAALALAPAGMAVSTAPPAEVAAAIPLASALVVGGVFGAICALVGELVQRIFYAHADTHFDPPAAAIVVGTFLIAVLAIVGVFPQSVWVPTLGL
ncbi:hypothetical protein M0R88_17570 [Halorussus gelatinilyticus]|uniref:DUF7973 domain-containing protein n=1 Tax=Halorussus gelatinilyticus TaxID=2937524 RepID=A0A8U0IJ60_9EURY|nr:hypothetical protein [Halorussus gelatinilyticus]UPW00304.1 hypothetical protein M0R88_17570 [Halorussus gelatinilyticus]